MERRLRPVGEHAFDPVRLLEKESAMPVQVLVVDDQRIIRRVLMAHVEAHPDLDLCPEQAETGREAIALAERYRPDIVILDHEMPEMNGLDALPAIRRAVPTAVIVMYSSATSPSLPEEALRSGATAAIRKDESAPEDVIALVAGMVSGDG